MIIHTEMFNKINWKTKTYRFRLLRRAWIRRETVTVVLTMQYRNRTCISDIYSHATREGNGLKGSAQIRCPFLVNFCEWRCEIYITFYGLHNKIYAQFAAHILCHLSYFIGNFEKYLKERDCCCTNTNTQERCWNCTNTVNFWKS